MPIADVPCPVCGHKVTVEYVDEPQYAAPESYDGCDCHETVQGLHYRIRSEDGWSWIHYDYEGRIMGRIRGI